MKNAQNKYAPNGTEARFILHTPWIIHPDDPLAELCLQSDGRLDLERLNEGGSRSKFGKIRAEWRNHLGIQTDEELQTVLRPLRIQHGRTLKELMDVLNDKLRFAGFKPIDEEALCNPYDEICRKLLQKKRIEFTRDELIDLCKRERLWMGNSNIKPGSVQIGIRSFFRWAENLEDQTDLMLDLLRYFDGRFIRSLELWNQAVYPSIESFLRTKLNQNQRYDIHLHAHISIAFAIGYCLDSKSGIDAAVVQSTRSGREIWRPSLHPNPLDYPDWEFGSQSVLEEGTDVVIALCVTHSITSDVRVYIERENLPIRRMLTFNLCGGPGLSSISGADHAKFLAERLSLHLREERT